LFHTTIQWMRTDLLYDLSFISRFEDVETSVLRREYFSSTNATTHFSTWTAPQTWTSNTSQIHFQINTFTSLSLSWVFWWVYICCIQEKSQHYEQLAMSREEEIRKLEHVLKFFYNNAGLNATNNSLHTTVNINHSSISSLSSFSEGNNSYSHSHSHSHSHQMETRTTTRQSDTSLYFQTSVNVESMSQIPKSLPHST
jgi:hypothetical protein